MKWLAETGARLVVACREEYWEGADFPEELLYGIPEGHLPPCVRLADLTDEEARRARARHTLPEGILTAPDDRHPSPSGSSPRSARLSRTPRTPPRTATRSSRRTST